MTGAGKRCIMCWVNDSYAIVVTGADPWAVKQAELGFPEDLDDALLILPDPSGYPDSGLSGVWFATLLTHLPGHR